MIIASWQLDAIIPPLGLISGVGYLVVMIRVYVITKGAYGYRKFTRSYSKGSLIRTRRRREKRKTECQEKADSSSLSDGKHSHTYLTAIGILVKESLSVVGHFQGWRDPSGHF